MSSLRTARTPAFVWQAGLILLPVIVIAAVALMAIVDNRTAVEREAHRQAEEVSRQYSRELGLSWGSFLAQHNRYSERWSDYLAQVVGGWPGGTRRMRLEAEAARSPERNLRARGLEWQAQYPDFHAEQVFPDRFRLTVEGRFPGELEYAPAPQPPKWFTDLSPSQRAAWDGLTAAAAAGTKYEEIEQRIAQFHETGPEVEAGINAAFIGLRARLPALLAAEAMAEALRFADENPETLSEVGLPLANLAFGEALRYARATGPSEELWDAIPRQVFHSPSPLIPALLNRLEELAGTNTTLQAGVEAWRTLWGARLKRYAIAEAVRQTGKLRGLTTANFWIEHDRVRWLCLLNPQLNSPPEAVNGDLVGSTDHICTEVRLLPRPLVERALVRALEASGVKQPAYLGLAVWLEGEPLTLPARWSPGRDTNSEPLFLVEANGSLFGPAKPRGTPDGSIMDYEWQPSPPVFVVQLYVTDTALLFASYRRQAWILTGLVGASAFAALVGVAASWLAFRRQLRLSELKSNFVSSVSHELRAPIASVRLMAESLERGKVPEAPKQQEYFRFIVQECRRLSDLIENVLDFSRIEQGRKQYNLEPTDLLALTRQTVKVMETYASECGVKLVLHLPTPQSWAPDFQPSADGKALQQALVNLIDNALKHSPKGETVTVGLETHSPQSKDRHDALPIHLWVEDRGEGIPMKEQERIFERFYRSGSELRRRTQGVGIGLSIVKHIVEAHGGRVAVRSAPGQGSRFTIELPPPPIGGKAEAPKPKVE